MNPKYASASGFTLVEIMMVAILGVLLGAGLITTYLTGQTSYLSADAYIQVQQEARRAFDNMVRELRESGNISCGMGQTTTTCTDTQLNFQITRGYNQAAPCPANLICYGSENAALEWVHYGIIVNATNSNNTQLVRYITAAGNGGQAAPASCLAAANCRVLANNIDTTTTTFVWDSANRVVTLNVQIRYTSPKLPGGTAVSGGGWQTTGPLTTRVKLRNS